MAPDSRAIDDADDRLKSSAALIREQLLLIADLRAEGRPSNRAEEFLQLLCRARAAFCEDLQLLRRQLAGPG